MASLIGCLMGSLLTAATPLEVLRTFYERVRPFGFWAPVRAAASTPPDVIALTRVAINVIVGVTALMCAFLSVFFLIGHYFAQLGTTVVIVLICAVILYHGWYRRLPTMCPE
jgi:hypothetical protein